MRGNIREINSKSVTTWVEAIYRVKGNQMKELYQSKISFDFLIVWSIFETECFKKFMRVDNVAVLCKERKW